MKRLWKYFLARRIRALDPLVDEPGRVYVVKVPNDTPAREIMALSMALDQMFISKFIVLTENVTVEEITAKIRRDQREADYHPDVA